MVIVAIVLRVLHIAFAVIAAGAVFYQFIVVQPALAGLDDGQRRDLAGRFLARWRGVAWTAMIVLLATGLLNFLLVKVPLYRGDPHVAVYHALFGVKFLLALAVFHAVTVLTLPGEKFDKYRQNARGWFAYVVALLIAIIIIGGVMNNFGRLFG